MKPTLIVIDSETYKSIGGNVITRHMVTIDDRTHTMDTRGLWQLAMLAIVELGHHLADPRDKAADHE